MVSNSMKKFIGPIIVGGIAAAGTIEMVKKQGESNIEKAKILAQSQENVAHIHAESQERIARINIESQERIASVNTQSNTTLTSPNTNVINSPKESESIFEFFDLFGPDRSFEFITGVTLFSGGLTCLFCIICLFCYVMIFKLQGPLENYYSGRFLIFLKWLQPFSQYIIYFYLSIVIALLILFTVAGFILIVNN